MAITITNPAVGTSRLPLAKVGEPYSFQFEAESDSDGSLTWGSYYLPEGFTLNESGLLQGTPTQTSYGDGLYVTVTNDAGDYADGSYMVTVGDDGPIEIVTSDLPIAVVGDDYATALEATGGDMTYEWSITSGNLPAGLDFSNNGVIQGTTDARGSYSITVIASDSSRSSEPKELSLTVSNRLVITKPSEGETVLPTGYLGSPYTFQFEAVGDGDVTWAAEYLPEGFTLSESGLLTLEVQPQAPLYDSVTVEASSGGLTVGLNIGLTIVDSNPIVINGTPFQKEFIPFGEVGVPYSYQIDITGGQAPYTVTVAESFSIPEWATLSESGVISGIPTDKALGREQELDFPIVVRDSSGLDYRIAEYILSMEVLLEGAPMIDNEKSGLIGTAYYGEPFSHQFEAYGDEPITWSFINGSGILITDLHLSSEGLLEGTVTSVFSAEGGEISGTLRAENSVDYYDLEVYLLVVDPNALTGINTPLPNGKPNVAYSFQFEAIGGVAPYTWTTDESIGEYFSLSEGGLLTGTAPAGYYGFPVSVTDTDGRSIQDWAEFTVEDSPLTIITVTIPDSYKDVPYEHQLEASGGDGNYIWTVDKLPPGLTLDPNTGIISGTPTVEWTDDVTIGVGSDGDTVVNPPIPVKTVPAKPRISSPIVQIQVDAGDPVNIDYNAIGTLPISWSTTGPDWLTINSGSGVISGTAPSGQSQDFTVTVRASNEAGYDEIQLLITVVSVEPDGPTITTTQLPDGVEGRFYAYQLSATGGKVPYAWSGVDASGNFSVGSSGGLIGSAPKGTYSIDVTVQDSNLKSSTTTLSLTIQESSGEYPDDEEWLSVYGGRI